MVKQLVLCATLPIALFGAQTTPLTFSEGRETITAYVHDQAIGKITWTQLDANEIEVEMLYVLPEFRTRGFARALLGYALDRFSRSFKKCFLSVFPFELDGNELTKQMITHPDFDNAYKKMRRFYARNGFQDREGYPRTQYMECSLMPRQQALAHAARPQTLQTVAGELA